MKQRQFLLILLVIVLAAGAYFFWSGRSHQVEVATARIGPAAELVYATGFVEAEQPVSVSARITAPVVQVLVDEGQHVSRGQPLVLLEDAEQHDLVAQAQAQRRKAVLDEQRAVTLFRKGWVTRSARDEAVAGADAARAAERSASARLDQLVLRAGIDGQVLKRDVQPGDLATPSRVLLTLGDPARIWVTATVDERDVPQVHIGQTALMRSDAWPGRVIRGHVRELTPGGDPTQRAFRARIALDESAALPMGLTLEVNILIRSTPRALLVPARAVEGDSVWVVDNGHARRRKVRMGISAADDVQLMSGIHAGEHVILNPVGLKEGERVRAKPGVASK
jgi:RND family efflux transporter MFP subunit